MRAKATVIAAVLLSALVSGGWFLQRGLSAKPGPVAGARLFDAVKAHVERFYVDSVGGADLYEKAMAGMLQELHDPNTLYLKPDRVRRLEERVTGNYAGIGVQVELRDRWPTVIGTRSATPSERAGLRTGDRIAEIDGRSTHGWTADEAIRAIRGTPGTKVELVLERPGASGPIHVSVQRDEIHRRSVGRASLVGDGVGYVDLNIFSDSTAVELSRAIDSLRALGMKGLILDVRGNPGGILAQGVGVADLFLDTKLPIVSMRGRTPETNQVFYDSAPERWPGMPLVLLVDEGSASASEIVAGALQDHDRALLLGHSTFGKGSAQTLFPTSTGGALKLTIARWFTPVGRSIDRPRHGVGDDLVVRDSAKAPSFKTEHGRTVFGGGGITPDVQAGDTIMSPAAQAFETALGSRVTDFRDAMTAYALSLKTAGSVRSPEFQVTPEMREHLWTLLRARGFTFDRSIYDGASTIVSRLLAREIARFVFGPAAETQRSIAEDEVITRGAALLRGVTNTDELLRKATARR